MLNHMARAAAGSAVPPDPDFDKVVLLLQGNGTNGANNKSVQDSGPFNITLTKSNTVNLNINSILTPFRDSTEREGKYSVYFDGTNDWLSLTSNSLTVLGSSNFTIECWVYITTLTSNNGIYCRCPINVPAGLVIAIVNSNLTISYASGANVWGAYQSVLNTGVTVNAWHHIAVVRNGNSITGYLNGISSTSLNITTAIYDNNSSPIIGSANGGNTGSGGIYGGFFNGYITNFRFIKGVALYTSNFTPVKQVLTATAETSFLTCQSNRFKDNSINNLTISRNGNAAIDTFSFIPPSKEYDLNTDKGSFYVPVSNAPALTASNAALAFGTGDFTFEYWIRNSLLQSSSSAVFDFSSDVSAGDGGRIQDYGTSWWVPSIYPAKLQANIGINAYQFEHVAWVRKNSVLTVYVNGVNAGSTNDSTNYTAGQFRIGLGAGYGNPYYAWEGLVKSLRAIKGDGIYTSNFTPPEDFSVVSNTALLIDFKYNYIFDGSGARQWMQSIGNAQITTAEKKYGTGSLSFNGSTDYLVIKGAPSLNLGTGNFTLECWVYLNSTNSNTIIPIYACDHTFYIGNLTSQYVNNNRKHMGISNSSNTDVNLNYTSNYFDTYVTGVWYHLAWVRNGTTIRTFVDGYKLDDGYQYGNQYSTAINSGYPSYVAVGRSNYLNGYIDDLRITKSVRYWNNFVPPNRAFSAR